MITLTQKIIGIGLYLVVCLIAILLIPFTFFLIGWIIDKISDRRKNG